MIHQCWNNPSHLLHYCEDYNYAQKEEGNQKEVRDAVPVNQNVLASEILEPWVHRMY